MIRNPSADAELLMCPRWQQIAGAIWRRIWPAVAIALLFGAHALMQWCDRQDERHTWARERNELRLANVSCDLMNTLPSHIFVIEAKSFQQYHDKLMNVAIQADSQRMLALAERASPAERTAP